MFGLSFWLLFYVFFVVRATGNRDTEAMLGFSFVFCLFRAPAPPDFSCWFFDIVDQWFGPDIMFLSKIRFIRITLWAIQQTVLIKFYNDMKATSYKYWGLTTWLEQFVFINLFLIQSWIVCACLTAITPV